MTAPNSDALLVGSRSSEQSATLETPGRVIDLMVALKECLAGQPATGRVGFPRAEAKYPLGYYRFYERDCKTHMRAWVAQELASFFDLYPPVRSTALADHRDALIAAEMAAAEEIRRPLNTNEVRLVGEAVRDILTARLVMPV
jgi:hypothetical protein